jgi:hypothetical protein
MYTSILSPLLLVRGKNAEDHNKQLSENKGSIYIKITAHSAATSRTNGSVVESIKSKASVSSDHYIETKTQKSIHHYKRLRTPQKSTNVTIDIISMCNVERKRGD